MPNTIIRASAGSGKTYQLSNQFLQVVLKSGGERTSEIVSTILASTFTRKAAGEILDRILQRLAAAAVDPKILKDKKEQEKAAKDRKIFVNYLGLSNADDAQTKKRLQEIVAEIAKNLYRLRICTLDSFFNKIASSFAWELKLPLGWTIIDEAEYTNSINEAVRQVFEENRKNGVRKISSLLPEWKSGQELTKNLSDLAGKLLPLVQSTNAEHWDHSAADKLGSLTSGKMTDEDLQRRIDPYVADKEVLNQLLPKTKKGEPDGNCVKDIDRFMNFVKSQDWEAILTSKIGENFALGTFLIRNKPVDPPLVDVLFPLVNHARAVWMETIVHQTAATRTLLDLVREKLQLILFQNKGFRFDDIAFYLGEQFRQESAALPQELLAHRIDAETKHLLLDEFQDTSLTQWDILKPFVRAVDKGKKTFFCVGDLKQAIYGWRGGVAEIFETVENFLKDDGIDEPPVQKMNETRRNSLPVIGAVNQIFLNIAANVPVTEKSQPAADKWAEWFGNEPHQTLSGESEKGFFVLESILTEEEADGNGKSDDGENSDDENEGEHSIDITKPFWKNTLQRVEEIHKKHPNRNIGILFRSKKDVPAVLQGLKNRNIEASDEGGVPLTDSAAVQQILSVMTLIDHPGDRIARFHLAKGPLAGTLSLQNYDDKFEAARVARHWRRELLENGYGNTVKKLIEYLTPCGPKEQNRLEKLLELAYQFDEQAAGVRSRKFIETVKRVRVENPTAAKIRVMTIHGSKGLEFDIVILPDLNGSLVGRPPKVIVSRNSPEKPVNFVLRWISKKLQPLLPKTYQESFDQWKDAQVKESLAVLYVAMTRARHELVMFIPDKSKSGTYADVLRAGFHADEKSTGVLYKEGNENWDGGIVSEKKESKTILWKRLPKKKLLRNLHRITPSGLELQFSAKSLTANAGNTMTEESGGNSRHDAALRGTAMHECFSRVKWLDGDLDKNLLQKIVEKMIKGKRGSADPAEIVEAFLTNIKKSEVEKIFLRSNYPATEEIDVECERRFAVRIRNEKEEELLHGSIDRLMIHKQNGKIVALEIIDFKTDHCPEGLSKTEFVAERQKIYAPQMDAYKKAVSKLYPNVSNITVKIVFVSVNEVV